MTLDCIRFKSRVWVAYAYIHYTGVPSAPCMICIYVCYTWDSYLTKYDWHCDRVNLYWSAPNLIVVLSSLYEHIDNIPATVYYNIVTDVQSCVM